MADQGKDATDDAIDNGVMTVMGGYIERLRIPDGYRCFGAMEVFGRITGDELSDMTS